jgi:NAD(P)-dependent dehydrogenase (short-subunit alcohol dehydrogenase family)
MGGSLAGKAAIVTGSTSGIGRATAILFAKEGANVVVTGRRTARGEQVVKEIKDQGGSAIYVRTDVLVADDLKAMVRSAVDTFGRLDILVNNAISGGPGSFGSVVDTTEEGWEVMIRSGLTAAFLGSKFSIPEMVRVGGGAIINMSSANGLVVMHNMAAYSAVKAGLINLTRQMAMDVGQYGIRVNAVCPGYIRTERELAMRDREGAVGTRSWYKELTTPVIYALRRAGRPEEVAQACLFLASEASSFVTGATLAVDGGLSIVNAETLAMPLGQLFRQTFAKEWGIDLHPKSDNA